MQQAQLAKSSPDNVSLQRSQPDLLGMNSRQLLKTKMAVLASETADRLQPMTMGEMNAAYSKKQNITFLPRRSCLPCSK